MNSAFRQLIQGMVAGRSWEAMGNKEQIRELLWSAYGERYHSGAHHRAQFQVRANMQTKPDAASYAGWITAENPSSGPYQGTSFVWFLGKLGVSLYSSSGRTVSVQIRISSDGLAIGADSVLSPVSARERPGSNLICWTSHPMYPLPFRLAGQKSQLPSNLTTTSSMPPFPLHRWKTSRQWRTLLTSSSTSTKSHSKVPPTNAGKVECRTSLAPSFPK